MSDELTVHVSYRYNKGSVLDNVIRKVFTSDITGTAISRGVVDLTATYEQLPMGDVATPGMCVFENLSTTEDIHLNSALTGGPLVTLQPGEAAIFTPHTAGWSLIAAKAETSAASLRFFIPEA